MSRVRSAAIVALMSLVSLLPTASAAGAICPQTTQRTALRGVTLFDGVPTEQVSLAPDSTRKVGGADRSEWTVGEVATSDRHLYVQCDYGPKNPALTLRQPTSTTRCTLLARGGTLVLTYSGR